MVTFTLGLGLEGLMDYIPDYETSLTGDFAKIKAGTAAACSWTAGVCDWPVPVLNEPGTLDDLWHAAVNGRGNFFSASDPNSLALGLQSALAKLKVATAAASASATSSPNITQTSNYIFSSTFRTGMWDGEIVAQRIDLVSGAVIPAIVWSAQANLDSKTFPTNDFRVIWTLDDFGGSKKKNFKFAALTPVNAGAIVAEQSYFKTKCMALAQCTLLNGAQRIIADDGNNLVDYLRGQRQYESFTNPETISPFRLREHVLGDPVNATPSFIREPQFRFADPTVPTYEDFKLRGTAASPSSTSAPTTACCTPSTATRASKSGRTCRASRCRTCTRSRRRTGAPPTSTAWTARRSSWTPSSAAPGTRCWWRD